MKILMRKALACYISILSFIRKGCNNMKRLFLMFLSMITAGTIMLSMTVYAEEASCDADQILEVLAENTSLKRVDEWQIKPAEFNEDGTLPYVSLLHLQELDGILIRCIDETALNNIAGNRLVYPLEDFISIHDQIEKVDGREKNTERDNLAEYFGDNYYVVEMCFGVFPAESKQRLIVESIIDNPKIELVGILRTDWYVKGFYDDMNTGLYIVPADDSVLQPDALDSEEYCNLDYKSQLSEYQLSYIRDLPQNTGFATVKLDGRTYEEIVELCNKLESRPDISYAWIAPVYLEDMLTNDGDYSYSLYLFSSDLQPDVTTETREADMTYTETTTTTATTPTALPDTTEDTTTTSSEQGHDKLYQGYLVRHDYQPYYYVGDSFNYDRLQLCLFVLGEDGTLHDELMYCRFFASEEKYQNCYTVDTSAVDFSTPGDYEVTLRMNPGERALFHSKASTVKGSLPEGDYNVEMIDYSMTFTVSVMQRQDPDKLFFTPDYREYPLGGTYEFLLRNAKDKDISCEIEDETIAVIRGYRESGKNIYYSVELLAEGETTLTAVSSDGQTASVKLLSLTQEEYDRRTHTTMISSNTTTTTTTTAEPNQEYDYEGAFRVSSYPWFNWVGEELDFSEMKLELLVMNSDGKFSATVLPFSFTVQSGLYSDCYTIDTSAVDSTKEGNYVVNVSTKAGEIITVSKDKDYRIKLTDHVSPFTAQYHEKQTLLHFSNGSGENNQVNCLLNEKCTVGLYNVNGSEIISCVINDPSIAEIVEADDRGDFCNYKIKGLQIGETVITAETADGRTASCVIRVAPFEELFPDTTTDSTTVVSSSETTTTALSGDTEASNTNADLPQTGNHSPRNLLIVLGASWLIGFGMLAVVKSGFIRRRKDEQ